MRWNRVGEPTREGVSDGEKKIHCARRFSWVAAGDGGEYAIDFLQALIPEEAGGGKEISGRRRGNCFVFIDKFIPSIDLSPVGTIPVILGFEFVLVQIVAGEVGGVVY